MKTPEPEPCERELGKLWALFLEWHENGVLLHHPDYGSCGESQIIHMPPLIGISARGCPQTSDARPVVTWALSQSELVR